MSVTFISASVTPLVKSMVIQNRNAAEYLWALLPRSILIRSRLQFGIIGVGVLFPRPRIAPWKPTKVADTFFPYPVLHGIQIIQDYIKRGPFPDGMRIPCSPTIVNELPRSHSHHLLSPCPAKMRGMGGADLGDFLSGTNES